MTPISNTNNVPASYTADETFTGMDYSGQKWHDKEVEYCTFRNCDFTDAKLFSCRFLETEFIDCNFSNAKLSQSLFSEVIFDNCKMLGLRFDECNPFNFSATFRHCQLNHSSFYRMNLKRTVFTDSQLQEADFAEADLEGSTVTGCDLLHAQFENSNLEQADFRNSVHYSINPAQNRLKGATFSYPDVLGLLDIYGIEIDT